jgi:N-acetylmuramoyl-L-alanine amidase
MAMSLSDYPRPPADTGWGMHDSAGTEARPADAASYARHLRQDLGITWFKALVSGTNKVDLVEAFTRQGIEVVVRLYAYRPHPHYVVSPADVRAYVQAGAHYFEWGNEPNLHDEWDMPSWHEGARVDKVCQQWLRNADAIRQGGGIPLMVALTPGGHYPHRDWYRTTFEWLRLHGHLGSLDGAALAIHNRPLNRPLGHLDPLGASFLEYEWISDLVRAYVGRSLPLLGTEAGYEPGWDHDPTFPPIDLTRHAEYNVELLRCFGPYGSRRWRDELFCQCMWLVESFGHHDFSEAAWHRNQKWTGGADLPALGLLRSEWRARPFQRQLVEEKREPDYPEATWRGSPNSDARPAGALPAIVVLYSTGADFDATMKRLRDPAAQVSYHYVVSRSGAVYQLVPEAERAWHAGNSHWQGRRVNDYGLAVGLIHRDGESEPFPAAQLKAAAALVGYLMAKYEIDLADVVSTELVQGRPAGAFDLEAFRARLGQAEPAWPDDEEVRAAAWASLNIPYSAEAVFPRYAREHNLGNPETPEFEFLFDGRLYRGQGYSEGIVYAEVGQWGEPRILKW